MYVKQSVFKSEKIMGHSKTAAALCNWVKAIEKYVLNLKDASEPILSEGKESL